jgi:murein peptide amidase A
MTVTLLVSGCASAGDGDAISTPTVESSAATTPATTTGEVFAPAPSEGRASLPAPATTTTVPPTTTTIPPTTSTTTTTTTIPPTTTSTTTTVAPQPGPAAGTFDFTATDVLVGTSVEGRPIIAERHGTIGGRRVLVIGVIHGNEDAGVAVIDELRRRSILGTVPDDVELWLVESMNPDGQAAQTRQNANQVDLNRNFPHEWGPIGQPGVSQYAGTGPASEPETQAMVAFISQLAPDIAIWYHQDANLIIPSTGRQGRIRSRYAELTGLPLAECCSGGGVFTGIAATWARVELSEQEAVPFIVELPGGDLSPEQVEQHTTAVLTIASEG